MSYHKPSTNIIYYYYSKTKIKFSKWESQNLGCGRLTQGVSSSESADSWAQPQWFWLRRSGVTSGVWSFNTDLRLHFAHCYFKGVNTASGKVRGATRNGETTEPTRQREGNSGGLWLPFSSLPRYPTSSPTASWSRPCRDGSRNSHRPPAALQTRQWKQLLTPDAKQQAGPYGQRSPGSCWPPQNWTSSHTERWQGSPWNEVLTLV